MGKFGYYHELQKMEGPQEDSEGYKGFCRDSSI